MRREHLVAPDRHKGDAPSIGLILCKSKNEIVAEYALRDVNKPIGVAMHLTREIEASLPKEFQYSLPTIEEIEAELAHEPNADINSQ
jgi:hypothetical protein